MAIRMVKENDIRQFIVYSDGLVREIVNGKQKSSNTTFSELYAVLIISGYKEER